MVSSSRWAFQYPSLARGEEGGSNWDSGENTTPTLEGTVGARAAGRAEDRCLLLWDKNAAREGTEDNPPKTNDSAGGVYLAVVTSTAARAGEHGGMANFMVLFCSFDRSE